jgi:hypothetical protein
MIYGDTDQDTTQTQSHFIIFNAQWIYVPQLSDLKSIFFRG